MYAIRSYYEMKWIRATFQQLKIMIAFQYQGVAASQPMPDQI